VAVGRSGENREPFYRGHIAVMAIT